MITNDYVFFWGGICSQWYASEFEIDGQKFSCAEQYMMYKKALLFEDEDVANAIMRTQNPREQKALGRKVRGFDKDKWEANCRQYVYEGNLAKFTQNPDLLEELESYGDREIVEASPEDKIWGIGLHETNPDVFDKSKWQGTNWLGEAIMRVRETLKTREEGDIFFGTLSGSVLLKESEGEQDVKFMELSKEWGDKGYNITSGKVSTGDVDELWATPIKEEV